MTAPKFDRIRFRCSCGRSVSTTPDSRTAETHTCSRCQVRDANLLAHRSQLVRRSA